MGEKRENGHELSQVERQQSEFRESRRNAAEQAAKRHAEMSEEEQLAANKARHDEVASILRRRDELGLPSLDPPQLTPTVRIPGGFEVRRYFGRKVLRELPDRLPAEITMVMAVDDNVRTSIYSVQIDAPVDALDDDALRLIGSTLVEARDEILRIEAQETTPDRGYTPAEASDATTADELERIISRDVRAARSAVRTARRRRQVTPELLARVLELYDEGGVEAVKSGTNYSESYCFKLLRKAREEVTS
jgi:hypothetical protein